MKVILMLALAAVTLFGCGADTTLVAASKETLGAYGGKAEVLNYEGCRSYGAVYVLDMPDPAFENRFRLVFTSTGCLIKKPPTAALIRVSATERGTMEVEILERLWIDVTPGDPELQAELRSANNGSETRDQTYQVFQDGPFTILHIEEPRQ